MPSALVDAFEKLKAKRKELDDIFLEAGPDFDMAKVKKIDGDSKGKVEEIQRRNKELEDLGKQYSELADLDRIAAANRAAASGLILPNSKLALPGRAVTEGEEDDPLDGKSIGDWFVQSIAYKEYNSSRKRGPEAELKTAQPYAPFWNGAGGKATLDETNWPPQAVRIARIQPVALRRPVVADMIPQGTTDQIAIVYLEETVATNNAAAVSEGGTKPESSLTFVERTSTVRKIATVLPITDELMQDAPAMRSYVDARLRLFLALEEEREALNGSGVAPELLGFYNVAGVQTQAKGAEPTPDAFYKAIVLIEINAFLEPNAIIMHPLDWQDIKLLRTADGIYIYGGPAEPGPDTMWGLPVVATVAATQNTGLVGAFDTASQMFRKEGVTFSVSDQHADFFITNRLMLRVEERLALAVYRPAAICKVSGI